MKKLISILLLCAMFSNVAFAECDFKTGISPIGDGNYKYSKECHEKVGAMVQDIISKDKQIADYKKAITLKDLALDLSDKRTQLWMDTSFKLDDRVQKIDQLEKSNSWMYFALGALTVFGAGVMAAQLSHR